MERSWTANISDTVAFVDEYAPIFFWSLNGVIFLISVVFVSKIFINKQKPNRLFWILILFIFGIIGCNVVTAFFFRGLDIMWTRISTYNATSFLIISFLFFSHNTFRILYAHDNTFGPYVRFSQILLITSACLLTLAGNSLPVVISSFSESGNSKLSLYVHAAYILSVPLLSGLVVLPSCYNMYQINKIRAALSLQLSGRANQLLTNLTRLVL
jgi:hypothetical protein